MKHSALMGTALAAVVCGMTISAPAAQADPGSPGCVTRVEYNKARKGMTQSGIHAMFGTAGKRMSRATSAGYVAEVRSYPVCRSQFSTIAISWSSNPGQPLRLSAKSAVWVS
jgi:hypothetical protein